MTSNVFKIVLPAFALMLAIIASFAFTPMEEDAIVTTAFYQNPDEDHCQEVTDVNCETVFQPNGFCSVEVNGVYERLYLKNTASCTEFPIQCACNITLYKPN